MLSFSDSEEETAVVLPQPALQSIVLKEIQANALYLRYSAVENDNRWGVLYTGNSYASHDYDIWGSYYNEIQNLKSWYLKRMDWLKAEYDTM